MKVVFRDQSFAFEFVRNLGFMYYGGSDLGEMIAASGRITEGDFESWFTEWDKLARRLLLRADASLRAGHGESARQLYLRASTYFRIAEFYLHGDAQDPRILSGSNASQKAYAEGAKLSGLTWEQIEIPYEGTTLPGYFYKVDNSGQPRPTLIFHGGYDSSLEELFYFGGAAAIQRGFNCLTFDGPGQGAPLREQKLYFRYDWEQVVTPVVDYALSRLDVDGNRLALMGMSMGGYLAARTVAFEHRFCAAVLFNGLYSFYETIRGAIPKDALTALDAGDARQCEEITSKHMQDDTNLRWLVTQGVYSFGASGLADFLLTKLKGYTMDGLAGQIQCPCLVLDADGDFLVGGKQAQKIYDALQAPKQFFRFTSEDGAENHCESGALAYKDEVVFNWLEDTMKLQERDGFLLEAPPAKRENRTELVAK